MYVQNPHNHAHTGERVALEAVEHGLRDRLKQLLGLQVRLPEALGHTKQVLTGRAAHDKVLGKVEAADQVGRRNERFVLRVEARDDRLDKVRAEPPLVQRGAHEPGKRLRLDLAVLLHAVHVEPVPELFKERRYVRSKARQAHVCPVGDAEHLVKVVREQQALLSNAQVGRDRHAVLAAHGDHTPTIVFHNTHCPISATARSTPSTHSCPGRARRCGYA